MTSRQLIEKMGLSVLQGNSGLDREITGGYVSDLLSDVMGHAKEGEVWITLQAHINVVAIASLKELGAIILVNGIEPAPEVLAKAEEEEILVLSTRLSTFECAGMLFKLLTEK